MLLLWGDGWTGCSPQVLSNTPTCWDSVMRLHGILRDWILIWRNRDSTLVTTAWFCWGHEGGAVLGSCIFSALPTADVLAGKTVTTQVDFVYQSQKSELKSGSWRPLFSKLLLSWSGSCAQHLLSALAVLPVRNLVLVPNIIKPFLSY